MPSDIMTCIMAYYNYKLEENGINPKPCAITDDDGEVVADDFPPDYNYLQDYVYKIVSSFDFIESPEECTIKIADENDEEYIMICKLQESVI